MAKDEFKLDIDPRLLRLRLELYHAAQTLEGNSLVELRKLINEIRLIVGPDEN